MGATQKWMVYNLVNPTIEWMIEYGIFNGIYEGLMMVNDG